MKELFISLLSDTVKNDVINKDLYNAKIKNIEYKIPDIANLATNVIKGKNTVHGTYFNSDLKGEEIIGTFHEKELLKANQENSIALKK